MKFQKTEILEYKKNTNVYLGKMNDSNCILIGDKKLPNEIELDDNITKDPSSIVLDSSLTNITNIYFPASNELIDSYKNKFKIVTETYEDYCNKIEPYIDSILEANTKWVKNILYHKMEINKILFKNKKFIVIKNISWDTNSDFYLLVIPFEPIKNIRHLNEEHRELLETMKKKSIDIAKKYNFEENDLYFFFHYHPSCYHLHLHVCLINHKSLKFKIYRHVLLDNILNDLENNKKKTMKFEIIISNPIYKLLNE